MALSVMDLDMGSLPLEWAIYGLIAGGVLGKKNYGGLGVGVLGDWVRLIGNRFSAIPRGFSTKKTQ